jgi:hypothetical protein
VWAQIDDGTDPGSTQDAEILLSSSEEVAKEKIIRPRYEDQRLPEF